MSMLPDWVSNLFLKKKKERKKKKENFPPNEKYIKSQYTKKGKIAAALLNPGGGAWSSGPQNLPSPFPPPQGPWEHLQRTPGL